MVKKVFLEAEHEGKDFGAVTNGFEKADLAIDIHNNTGDRDGAECKTKKTAAEAKKNYQCIHTIKKGESLWLLATRYLGSGTRYQEIMKLNGKNTAALVVGEKVKIPNK